MDETLALFLVLFGTLGVGAGTAVVLIRRFVAGIRSQISQQVQITGSAFESTLIHWLFDESSTELEDPEHPGTKKTFLVRTPSAKFKEMVGLVVPEIIGQGMLWAKQNVKLGDVTKMIGAPGGALSAAAPAIGQALKAAGVPKEWAGMISLLIQYKDAIVKFIPGLQGLTGSGGPGTTSGATIESPYVKQLIGK
jgi:hypothetical protein